MAKRFPILLLLGISLSPAVAYICSNNASSPPDPFEEHGCYCGTEEAAFSYSHLFTLYNEAFAGCFEGPGDDNDITIECAFIREEASSLKEPKQNSVVRNTSGHEWSTNLQQNKMPVSYVCY